MNGSRNCGGWFPRHSLDDLLAGITAGWIDEQDEYGMTALSLAVASGWKEGVGELIRAGANTGLRAYRTGETALYIAVERKDETLVGVLLNAGANADAANHWGMTPRKLGIFRGLARLFDRVPPRQVDWPSPWMQNAEHLADH